MPINRQMDGEDMVYMAFPGDSDGTESACNAGDLDSISGSEGSPGEGNGYPLQYSYLENSMDRGNFLEKIFIRKEKNFSESPSLTVTQIKWVAMYF